MSNIIVDSELGLSESLRGTEAPEEIIRALVIVPVTYWSFDAILHRGQIIVHEDVALDITEIFSLIQKLKFPVAKVIPIVHYKWDDDRGMADNNTSAFNYRVIYGTEKLSNHSYGRAIDINPLFNPYIARDGSIHPKGTTYNINRQGTLRENDKIVSAFLDRGWTWGGHWSDRKDWQHFEKS